MNEIDFFRTKKLARSGKERKKLLDGSKEFANKPSKDYMKFGFDYFDNPSQGIGYGGYKYDGRYADPVQSMCEHYGLKEGSKILEIGCAKGFILVEFHKLDLEVAGIDISEYAVENAHPDVRPFIKVASADALPFEDDYFDLVLGKEVLPHIPTDRIENVINECIRVSKGNLFFEIQTGETERELQNILKWDKTHTFVKPPSWWNEFFTKLNYPGDVNYKVLISEEDE